jgi:hypothetical protein
MTRIWYRDPRRSKDRAERQGFLDAVSESNPMTIEWLLQTKGLFIDFHNHAQSSAQNLG